MGVIGGLHLVTRAEMSVPCHIGYISSVYVYD